MALHSITKFIPLTPQTDPNNFPRGEYKPYPRMMVQKSGKPFFDHVGKPVIVQNEDEEKEFRDANEVRDNVASASETQGELAALRAENAKLKGKPSVPVVPATVHSLVKPKDDDPIDEPKAHHPVKSAKHTETKAAKKKMPKLPRRL